MIRSGVPFSTNVEGHITTHYATYPAGVWYTSIVKDENNLPAMVEVVSTGDEKSNFEIQPALLGALKRKVHGNILYIELEWVDPEKGWLEVDSSRGKVLIPQYGLYNIVAYVDGKLYQKMQVKYEGEEDMTVLEGPDWKLRFFRGWLGE